VHGLVAALGDHSSLLTFSPAPRPLPPPLQALLQQQLASGYSGLRGSTPQEQATLAALSALDPSMLQAHLTSGLSQHALSMQGSAQQQHGGMPSTPSVGGGSGAGALLGMTPSSPAGPGMSRYSTSGVGFGAAGAGSLGGQGAHRSSYTGASLESSGPGGGGYQQYRVSSSGSGLGGLGPIGPSAGASGHEGLFLDLQQQQAQQQQQQQQQQAGLMSPTWAGMAAASRGLSGPAGGASGAGQWPQQFVCPLSNQLMSDPVVAADGVSYQREAISDWMRLRDVSPVTGQPLGSAVLQPNYALRAAIAAEVAKVQGSRGLV
jgi:hypothetical protein